MALIAAAFYHFFDFPDFAAHQTPLLAKMNELGLKGSLLLAAEGMNATLTGTRENLLHFIEHLEKEIAHGPIEYKESPAGTQHPFGKAKVRLKKETISLGEQVNLNERGTYITPAQWNALISDPETLILDTRNDYEVHLGTFEGATNPSIRTFKELPAYTREHMEDAKEKKIATFCTGGIRCEKYTAWLTQQGFKHVYHLQGGILKYLEEIPKQESLWRGECYVFDERVAVGHGLKPSETARTCTACGHALTPSDITHAHHAPPHHCPHCHPDRVK